MGDDQLTVEKNLMGYSCIWEKFLNGQSRLALFAKTQGSASQNHI